MGKKISYQKISNFNIFFLFKIFFTYLKRLKQYFTNIPASEYAFFANENVFLKSGNLSYCSRVYKFDHFYFIVINTLKLLRCVILNITVTIII